MVEDIKKKIKRSEIHIHNIYFNKYTNYEVESYYIITGTINKIKFFCKKNKLKFPKKYELTIPEEFFEVEIEYRLGLSNEMNKIRNIRKLRIQIEKQFMSFYFYFRLLDKEFSGNELVEKAFMKLFNIDEKEIKTNNKKINRGEK